MAQLALAAAGAAIGGFFGGPVGAQIGWAAGSLIGGVVFAPDQQGPRLQDTMVQVSCYGAAVPICFGGVRVAGNVIWSTDLRESSEEHDAKGGPSVTTYSYSVSCAVLICEGEVSAIRRIWADAKLVYDVSETASASARAESSRFAEFFTFYSGTETQDPDPTIEAVEGAGNVEAYRGCAYIVFTDLPLGDYGNRVPNFTFEITTEPAQPVDLESIVPFRVNRWALDAEGVPYHFAGPAVYDDIRMLVADANDPDVTEAGSFADYTSAVAAAQAAFGAEWNVLLGYTSSMNTMLNAFSGGAQITDDAEYYYVWVGRQSPNVIADDPLDILSPWPSFTFTSRGYEPEVPPYGYGSPVLARNAWSSGSGARGLLRLVYSTAVETPPTGYESLQHINWFYSPAYPITDPGPPVAGYYPTVVNSDIVRIRVKRTPFIPTQACEIGNPVTLGIAQLPSDAALCMSATGEISHNYQYTVTAGAYRQLTEVDYGPTALTTNGLGPVLRNTDPDYNSQAFWESAAAAEGVAGAYGVDYPVDVAEAGVGEAEETQAEAGSVALSEIVTALCNRAGLTAIDVTALTDTVRGFKIMRQMSARAAIEPLRQAFWFDGVENGSTFEFVKRGGASVATIEADDLGATESGDHVALVVPRRAQETELPAKITVAYECREADYQTGAQQSRRITTGSQQRIGVELPIVLSDQAGADIADVLMVDAWQGRSERKFSTLRKWSHILPTDVVTVDDGDFVYIGRITDKVEDGPVINWTMRDEAAATYSPNATPGTTSGGGGSAGVAAPMMLHLLDVPIVRQADDATPLGYYLAGGGFASGWPGGVAYRSADGGSTYLSVQDVMQVATMGYTETVLPSWAGGNVVDECSTVEVTLHAGTLSSITRDQLLRGGNPCVIGSEVLQFQRATLVSAGRYLLTGFLRARCGTEDQMTHALAERFVLLDPSTIYRPGGSLGEIGTDTIWKGVTIGLALADAYETAFTHSGRGALPLAPIQLAAGETGAPGSFAVTWVRRTRIPHPWMDGADAPLGEASEQYLVEVLDGETVDSSQTVVTPSATVTAAPGNTVRVRQVSDLIGPGMPATITIE